MQTLPIGVMLQSVFSPLAYKDGTGQTAADKNRTAVRAEEGGTLQSPDPLNAKLQGPDPPKQGTTQQSPTSDAVVFSLKARANTLVFEHACARGVENGAIVAAYTVVYADGKRTDIPLRYGYEIRALDDATASDSFSTDAHSLPVLGAFVTLRRLRWINPRPDALVAHIEFRARSPIAAPILFGVAGLP